MHNQLSQFIESERKRLDTRDANIFSNATHEIERYLRFLDIVLGRYTTACVQYHDLSCAFQATLQPGSGQMSDAQMVMIGSLTTGGEQIQFEIESYFLFSKILLDLIARWIEHFLVLLEAYRLILTMSFSSLLSSTHWRRS